MHVQPLHNQGKRLSITWVNGHNSNPRNDLGEAFAGRVVEDIQHSTSCLHQGVNCGFEPECVKVIPRGSYI
jgi:hypothetical protein